MSALSALLQTKLPEGWSARRVARETEGKEYEIKPATATAYLGGRHGKPDDLTLEAFHHVLGIPMRELRTAAGLTPDPGRPWTPPGVARYLDSDERKALAALIKVMTRGREVVMGNAQHPAPTSRVVTVDAETVPPPGSGTPRRGRSSPRQGPA